MDSSPAISRKEWPAFLCLGGNMSKTWSWIQEPLLLGGGTMPLSAFNCKDLFRSRISSLAQGFFSGDQRRDSVLFDMPNLNRFDILSISIFCKIDLSISIAISIFPKSPYRYRYRYRYFWNCLIDIDIDIDIYNFSISISIFFKSVGKSTINIRYRYIEQGY